MSEGLATKILNEVESCICRYLQLVRIILSSCIQDSKYCPSFNNFICLKICVNIKSQISKIVMGTAKTCEKN